MTTTVLIEGTLAAVQKKHFAVPRGEGAVTVFAHGLGVAETVSLQMLTAEGNADDADDALWTNVNDGAGALGLSSSQTRLVVNEPGDYRLVTTVTAGAVRIGVML